MSRKAPAHQGGKRAGLVLAVTGKADEEDVETVLDTYHGMFGIKKIVELGDPDAGMIARFWAEDRGIDVVTVRKETRFEACRSVMRRRPDAIVAFPDASMALVSRAYVNGVQVCDVEVRECGDT